MEKVWGIECWAQKSTRATWATNYWDILLPEWRNKSKTMLIELGRKSLHVNGTRGALFKITLWSHGYTFGGKRCSSWVCEKVEARTASVFKYYPNTRHTGTNGTSLNLRRSFSYDGIAEMAHFLFLSHVGRAALQRNTTSITINWFSVVHSDPMRAIRSGTKRTTEWCLSTSSRDRRYHDETHWGLYHQTRNASTRSALGRRVLISILTALIMKGRMRSDIWEATRSETFWNVT